MATGTTRNAMPRFGPWGTACAVLVAIGITASMDANGLSEYSAPPLFWLLERHSRQDMGIAQGRAPDYLLAIAHPVLVLGACAAGARFAGAADFTIVEWDRAVRDFAIMAGATIPAALLTEEGFFRGWLVASLRRKGLTTRGILAWSSIAFSLWHVSAVTLPTGFDLPPARIPVFLLNAAVIGAIWGWMRLRSGSILVASVSHGLWNGGAYVVFGFGQKSGALGVADAGIFGPESGLVGLALNVAFLALLLSRR